MGILSDEETPQIIWKKVNEPPWQQHNWQLLAQFICLKGWTFTVVVVSMKHTSMPCGFGTPTAHGVAVTFPDYSDMPEQPKMSIPRGAPGLEHGIKLVAMPLCIRPYHGENVFKMPVLFLYPTNKKINSEIIYERVGTAICYPRMSTTMALQKETDDTQFPSWTCDVFQTVYIG